MDKTAQAADEDNLIASLKAFAKELATAVLEIEDKESVKGKSQHPVVVDLAKRLLKDPYNSKAEPLKLLFPLVPSGVDSCFE